MAAITKPSGVARSTAAATTTIAGVIISHKQMPAANITQIRADGFARLVEFPDLRESGLMPGDSVIITIARKGVKS